MAVGASAGEVQRLLIADSLRPVAVGLAVGLGAALVLSRLLSTELSGISWYDPTAIASAMLMLLAGAATAAIVPARHAARTDPARMLRDA
jgi:ABC-type antimicrobial peptide transport system permease subunit